MHLVDASIWKLDESSDTQISVSQAGDDAKIRVWQVPEGGLQETITEPEMILKGVTEPTHHYIIIS